MKGNFKTENRKPPRRYAARASLLAQGGEDQDHVKPGDHLFSARLSLLRRGETVSFSETLHLRLSLRKGKPRGNRHRELRLRREEENQAAIANIVDPTRVRAIQHRERGRPSERKQETHGQSRAQSGSRGESAMMGSVRNCLINYGGPGRTRTCGTRFMNDYSARYPIHKSASTL